MDLKFGHFLKIAKNANRAKLTLVKKSVKNVTCFYNFAKLYNLSSLAETTQNYIQRCYTTLVETCFLELSFKLFANVLLSSKLNTHSEIEVFNTASN